MDERPTSPVRVGMITLGCPKNTVDSEEMLRGLVSRDSVRVVSSVEDAEVVVINTCAFIGPAKEESVETILQAVRAKEEGRHQGVVVVGCLAERYRDELQAEIPEVDAFLGVAPGASVVDACLESAHRSRGVTAADGVPSNGATDSSDPDRACQSPGRDLAARLTPFYSAYLKISEGCDNPCTFCAIPMFRGLHRSKPPEAVLAEVQGLVEQGVVELNVIAQDTTSYGSEFPYGPRIHDLLRTISGTPGVAWTRLLYAYPRFVTDDLLDTIGDCDSICNYIDMPIQHASESVLRRMGRGMDRSSLIGLIQRMRGRIPGLVLRTTILVGFPGETEADFDDLLGFLGEVRFERLGAFPYSHEEGTPSHRLDDNVPDEVKEERVRRVMELQQEIAFEHSESLIGATVETIVEARDREDGRWIGRTYGDAPEIDGRIFFSGEDLAPGRICSVRVTAAEGYDLEGIVESARVPGPGGQR